MKKIAVFGGSFNPVHKEHKKIVEEALKVLDVDKLIVMPAGKPPHKKGAAIADGAIRKKLLLVAFDGEEKVEVSDYELKKEGLSYTYETLEHLNALYKSEKTYFLVGTDMLFDFPTWKCPEKILKAATLFVTKREGEDEDKAERFFAEHFSEKVKFSPYVGKNISGTKIRAYLALGLNACEYLDENVYDYIKKNGLYSEGKAGELVRKNLPEKRLIHTAGVMTLAVRYARRLKVNADEAFLAAMLHDVAKYMSPESLSLSYPGVPAPVVHQFLGADFIKKELPELSEDIVNAVRYHTTGRANMTRMEQIIFLADLLEENRTFCGVDELRAAVEEDFDKGFSLCVKKLYEFLSLSGDPVYYLTKECCDYYAK